MKMVLPVIFIRICLSCCCSYSLPSSIGLAHAGATLYLDSDRFDPDRMLAATLTPTTWFPFGGGTERCLGADFAMVEMRMVLGEIAPGRIAHHHGRQIVVRAIRDVPSGAVPRSDFPKPVVAN
jgi:cytochrome P450 family 135